MDDLQWYATPPALAQRAWAKFKNRDFCRIIETSAGNGDLAEQSPWDKGYFRHGNSPRIDCCEIDISRHPILRAKGFHIVGFDFLQMTSGVLYRHWLMNPPFSAGARHVLKAWELLYDGEIVAIINAETLRNDFSAERKHLVRLIEQYGEVEYIKDAFSGPDAQRKTDVEVALVYLAKKANTDAIIGNLLNELKEDAASAETLGQEFRERCEVALPNSTIENSVVAFKAAVQSMRDSVFAQARANYYSQLLGDTLAVRNGDGDGERSTAEVSPAWVQRTLAEGYDKLKDAAWAGVLRSSNVLSRLSSGAQQRVESEFEQLKKLEFTVSNVYGFLIGIIEGQGQIRIDMACDIFDRITRYHTANTCYFNAWKSNDKHRTCGMKIKATRFVLPQHGTMSYSSSFSWDTERLFSDLDKVFSLLDGKAEPDVSLVSVARRDFKALRHGARVSSSYFDLRYYPGAGTLHFFPRSKTLVDRLNRMVGRHRQWLPDEGERVSKDFWLQFEKSESLDKELRTEIARGPKGQWWDNPLEAMHRSPDDERGAKGYALFEAALHTVLERHGINVNFQLEAPTQVALPLLAA